MPHSDEARKKYERDKLLPVRVAFNRNTEPELVRWIESKDNKSAYIKSLVRRDYLRQQAKARLLEKRSKEMGRTHSS